MDITIRCNQHDEVELSASIDKRGILCVDPCKKCLEEARDEGYTEGIKEGQDQY